MARVKRLYRSVVFGTAALLLFGVYPAAAVDAPKWVAALFMEAQGQVGLRWLPVPGATGYKVLRSEKPGSDYAEIAAPTQPQHFDSNVTPAMTYYYVLQAVAGAEKSPNSDERKIVLPAKAARLLPPVWKKVEMDVNAVGIALEWDAVAGGVAYNIYRRESFKPAGKEELIGSVQNNEPYMDKASLSKGVEYIYYISVLDSSFTESEKSSSQSAKFIPKEEVTVAVAKKEDKIAENWKVDFLGEMAYEPLEDEHIQGQIKPALIAAYEDEIYVYFTHGDISVYSDRFRFVRRFRGEAEGKFPSSPGYMAIDPDDGVLHLIDILGQRVMKYKAKDGTYLGEWSVNDGVDPKNPLDVNPIRPNRIFFSPDGSEIYLSEAGNHVIRVFDKKGKLLRRIGKYGSQPGDFSVPADMIMTKDKVLYVLEAVNARVQAIGLDGKSKLMFGEPGSRVGQFGSVSGMAYDPKKELLYVGDFISNVIHVWSLDGKALGVIKYADPSKERAINGVAALIFYDGKILVEDFGMGVVLALEDVNPVPAGK